MVKKVVVSSSEEAVYETSRVLRNRGFSMSMKGWTELNYER